MFFTASLIVWFSESPFSLIWSGFLISAGEEGEDQWEDEDAAGPGPWLWQGYKLLDYLQLNYYCVK
jgi:hypothetical protein